MQVESVRVVYATKTKHSKKIAEAIGSALKAEVSNVTDRPRVEEVELLFIVGGVYGGDSLPVLLDFVRNLDGDKVQHAALVTSCASKKHRQEKVRQILAGKGIDIVDEFLCQGSFLLYKWGRPNKRDVQGAVEFAKGLQETM